MCKPYGTLELIARIDTQLKLRNSWLAELEKSKADALLLKMLPAHIIQKLKDKGDGNGGDYVDEIITEKHDHVCILFSDVVGFTQLSSSISTNNIIEMLNCMFSKFDALSDSLGTYKVETIGDAYM